jgi:hypothetical protein
MIFQVGYSIENGFRSFGNIIFQESGDGCWIGILFSKKWIGLSFGILFLTKDFPN